MFTYKTIEETQKELESDKKRGLSRMQAAARLQRNGPNEMPAPKQPSLFFRFLEQLKDPLIYVLLAAAVISCFLDEWNDALIIGIVVFLNAAVGLIQEGKAKRALESLRALTTPKAMVIREGQRQEIAASQLVVGDLVCLETGCRVPADLRLVESTQLRAQENPCRWKKERIICQWEKERIICRQKKGRISCREKTLLRWGNAKIWFICLP